MKAIIQLWLTNWVTPYKRYQYQRNIHALRLALCVVFAIGLGSYFHLKHSEWIAITVFVVLGTIPYQGSIASKSYERILGTMFGMIIGLTMLWLNQNYLRHNILFFILVGLVSFACGFKSLGKRGYAFMLMGLTMCMLLGHSEGDDWVNDGIMRAVNVVLGAAISLAASQLIPLKSTLMWRFTLADNLNDCAKQLASVTGQKVILPAMDGLAGRATQNQQSSSENAQPDGTHRRRNAHQQRSFREHSAKSSQYRFQREHHVF